MTTRKNAGAYALFLLRLVVGYGFMAHGFAKLSHGVNMFATILQQLGVPFPLISAWLTIGTEIFGGLALLVGIFVNLASIPMAFVLITAAVTVHFRFGFSSIRLVSVSPTGARFGPVGYELDLLYMAALLAIVFAGPGVFAIDNLLRRPIDPATS